jgi:hypothetical protein
MIDLSTIPEDWFLFSMKDRRTPQVYKGDKHVHMNWEVCFQHVDGGRLTRHEGKTAEAAFLSALRGLN